MAQPEPGTSQVERGAAALVVLAAVGFVVAQVAQPEFLYPQWADRDMVRSDVPFWQLPSMGAESSFGFGARIPGGAMHVLWWLALRVFGADPSSVHQLQWLLVAVGAAALGWVVRQVAGALAGAVVFATTVVAMPTVYTLVSLWNPGFTVGLSVWVVVCAVSLVRTADARWLVPTWVLLAWDLHTHLSAGILVFWVLAVCVAVRPPGALRWGALGLLLALTSWSAYLLDDGARGWENTGLLLDRTQLDTLAPQADDLPTRGREAAHIVMHLSGVTAVAGDRGPAWGLGVATAALLVLGLVWRERGTLRPAATASLVGGLLVLCVVAAYFRSSANAGDQAAIRYLAVGSAGFPLFVGAAWGALAHRLGRWRPLGAVCVGALALGLVAQQSDAVRVARANPEANTWPTLLQWTSALRAHTGWSLADLTGRTVVVRPNHFGSGGWETRQSVSMAWPLAREGEVFPGSAEPPCALLFEHGRSFGVAALHAPDFATTALPFDRIVSIDAVWPVDELRALARYTPASGRCPSSFDARYVLTPEEELTRSPVDAPALGTAVRLSDDAGMRRWRFAWPLSPLVDYPQHGLLTARPVDGGWEVVLHANALRGRAWNYGFYANAAVVGPAVVVRDPTGAELGRIQLAVGVVGAAGALTPLRAVGELPDGAWSLELVSDVSKVPWDVHPADVDLRVPLVIALP